MEKLFGKRLSFRIVDRHKGTEREPPCLPNLSFTIIILFLDWVFALPNIEGMRHADLSVLVLRMLILVETLSTSQTHASCKHLKSLWDELSNGPNPSKFSNPPIWNKSPYIASGRIKRFWKIHKATGEMKPSSMLKQQDWTGNNRNNRNNTGNKKCEKCEKCDITMSQCHKSPPVTPMMNHMSCERRS